MPHNQPLHVLIFGAGAIGTYLGCSLHHSGCPVVLVEKPEVADELWQRGLHLHLPQGVLAIPTPRVASSIEQAVQMGPFDVAVCALKSFDTTALATSLAPHKDRLPPILCLQNGVDNEQILAGALGETNVISGTVTSSLLRRSAGDVALERKRGIGIAASHPLSERLVDSFNQAGLNARLYARPLDMKWSKLVTNLLGNASSAILDMTPAQIFAHPVLFQLECRQIRETLAVMQAMDIHTVDLPATPVRLLAASMQRLPTWLSRPLIQRSVGAGRGGKMPSLHMDLQSGRMNSEVEDLNGAVVRYGEKKAIPTPTNLLLYRTLMQLVKSEVPWSEYKRKPERLISFWQAGN